MTTSSLRDLVKRAHAIEPPLLSLYVPFTPGADRREAASRAHAALAELDVPPSISAKVESEIEQAMPRGRTLALFANRDTLVTAWLRLAVPVDEQTGVAHGRWGRVDITPLWYLESIRERAMVVFVDRDHARIFDVLLDDVAEIDRLDRPISDAEKDAQLQPRQIVDDHLSALSRQFHQQAVDLLVGRGRRL
jgi:hypothetical protein